MNGRGIIQDFAQLEHHYKFNTAYTGYCTIDGVAMTQIGDSRSVFLDSKGKTTDYIKTKKSDGRSVANARRKGEKLERNGKFIRSSEVRRTVISWVGAIGGISRVRFTTVSFPLGTPDHTAKACLNIFFTRWRKAIPDLSYLWTAERQTNGTIHFHIVTNRFTDVQLLNGWMKASLKTRLKDIPNYSADQLTIYNGVDIAARVYSKSGIEGYLAKYLTKAQNSGINQPWHRSRKMGELATKIRVDAVSIRSLFSFLKSAYISEDHRFRTFENDYCFYIEWPPLVSQIIKRKLLHYNRERWKGVSQRHQYHLNAQHVTGQKEQKLEKLGIEIGSQLDMLAIFPATNYQQKGQYRKSDSN